MLATANGAGYRYGVSDQAFYIPAIARAADPETFPRDASLIGAQARLMALDEICAAVVRATGVRLPVLFAAGYLLSLAFVWTALAIVGSAVYAHRWTVGALLAAYTLRHQITRTSANTLEPYFHPRMLAFGLCALAVAAVVRRKPNAAVALVAAGGLVHPTTAVWFAILVGVALVVSDRRLRPVLLAAAPVAAAAALWALAAGPLAGSAGMMDAEWRLALASKTTLFAHEWPVAAWVANLGTAAVLGWAYLDRRKRGLATAADSGLAAGAAALVGLFLVTLPFAAAGVAFVVKLQIPRVFWLVDLLATIYGLGAIERLGRSPRTARALAIGLIAASTARGAWALWIERPERRLFSFSLQESAWHDAMRWIASRPKDVHVLADPGHAWKYGSSVRVSAGRDVFQEDVKDSAMAIYSREVAMRVLERSRALGDFGSISPDRARALAARYDLDYLITTATTLDLPVVYRNRQFTVYALASATQP